MPEFKLIDSRSQRAAIRISIPLKVAMDGDLLNQSLAGLAEHIGCKACFSGVDCIFQLQRDLVIDEKYAISEADPRKLKTVLENPELVTAQLSNNDMMTIDSIYSVASEITKLRGGCPACHSGFDFTFQTEIEDMRQR